MKFIFSIACLLILICSATVYAQRRPVHCNGSAELPIREEQSIAALKAELALNARLNAMNKCFGTEVASIQTSMSNSNNASDTNMTETFRQFSQSMIKGIWAGDDSPVLYSEFLIDGNKSWMHAEVSGYAFQTGFELSGGMRIKSHFN